MHFYSPADQLRLEFLRALARDLRLFGHKANVKKQDNGIRFDYERIDTKNISPAQLHDYYKKLRAAYIKFELSFIKSMEKNGVSEFFVNGDEIDLKAVKPVIHICTKSQDLDLFKYCRFLQALPTSDGVGRRIRALVYDVGQRTKKIMGAICLSSTSYSLACRDSFLCWNDKRIAIEKAELICDRGLNQIMHLSICLAMPPYNLLHAGKLMALLAFSEDIAEEYNNRPYKFRFSEGKPKLLALITTCAFGAHAPIFNRIAIEDVLCAKTGECYKKQGQLFKKIGETTGYSTQIIGRKTTSLARKFVPADTSASEKKKIRTKLSKERVIDRALRICGINREVLYTNPKAVYFGCLSDKNLEILRKGHKRRPDQAPLIEDIYDYWFTRWATKGYKKNLDAVKKFKANSISILNEFKIKK